MARPVAHQNRWPQAQGKIRGHRAGRVQVAQLQAQSAGAFEPKNTRGIVHMHQHQAGVIFVVARIKSADHSHLLQAGHHAGRRHLPAWGHQRHRLANPHTQAARQLTTQHKPKLTRAQTLQRTAARLSGQISHLWLQRRVYAAHHRALHGLATGQQGLGCDERRCTHHLGVGPHGAQAGGEVG